MVTHGYSTKKSCWRLLLASFCLFFRQSLNDLNDILDLPRLAAPSRHQVKHGFERADFLRRGDARQRVKRLHAKRRRQGLGRHRYLALFHQITK